MFFFSSNPSREKVVPSVSLLDSWGVDQYLAWRSLQIRMKCNDLLTSSKMLNWTRICNQKGISAHMVCMTWVWKSDCCALNMAMAKGGQSWPTDVPPTKTNGCNIMEPQNWWLVDVSTVPFGGIFWFHVSFRRCRTSITSSKDCCFGLFWKQDCPHMSNLCGRCYVGGIILHWVSGFLVRNDDLWTNLHHMIR